MEATLHQNRELVHSRYRFVFEEKKHTAKGWRYQIVFKPNYGRPKTLSGWFTTAEAAWRGAAERIRGEDERGKLLQKLETLKHKRTTVVRGRGAGDGGQGTGDGGQGDRHAD